MVPLKDGSERSRKKFLHDLRNRRRYWELKKKVKNQKRWK
jgi:hypothetical protein